AWEFSPERELQAHALIARPSNRESSVQLTSPGHRVTSMTPFSCLGAPKRRPEHGSVQNLELNVRFFPFRERTRFGFKSSKGLFGVLIALLILENIKIRMLNPLFWPRFGVSDRHPQNAWPKCSPNSLGR